MSEPRTPNFGTRATNQPGAPNRRNNNRPNLRVEPIPFNLNNLGNNNNAASTGTLEATEFMPENMQPTGNTPNYIPSNNTLNNATTGGRRKRRVSRKGRVSRKRKVSRRKSKKTSRKSKKTSRK